jgi:predicted site-specific integrase-resolvase
LTEIQWLTLKECANHFEIDHNRLRDWTNKGLVEYDKRSNQRYIPSTELIKIEKIIQIFEEARKAGTRKTFDDVKNELQKENLFTQYQEDQEKKKIERTTEIALNSINIELKDTLMAMANGFKQIQEENQLIKTQFNQLFEQHNEALQKINALETTLKDYGENHTLIAAAIESQTSQEKETTDQISSLNKKVEEFIQNDREKRANDMLTKKKIETQLEQDALELWYKKPEEERIKKVGFFKKEEDQSKRTAFIKEYINLHFNNQIQKEYKD